MYETADESDSLITAQDGTLRKKIEKFGSEVFLIAFFSSSSMQM
jgi:hypothetical protein